MVAAMSNYLNCCFASIAALTWPFGILINTHKNSNVIPALSEF